MSSFLGPTFSQIPRPLGEQGFLSLGAAIRPAGKLNFLKRWGAFFTQGAFVTYKRGSAILKTGLREKMMAKQKPFSWLTWQKGTSLFSFVFSLLAMLSTDASTKGKGVFAQD